LTGLDTDWVSRIITEIETTEQLVEQLGRLAQELAFAAGGADGDSRRNTAMEQANFRLDTPFRRWLESIDPENDEKVEACDAWWQQERRIVQALGQELIEQAGPRAFVGREVKKKIKGKEIAYFYSAPKAFNRFMSRTSTRHALRGGKDND
jgi:CRISPR system Cascade subunit CasA